jgi:hypothetical protein
MWHRRLLTSWQEGKRERERGERQREPGINVPFKVPSPVTYFLR